MTAVTRLVTSVDADDQGDGTVSVSALHEVELADGRRVVLLADRGWGTTQSWAEASAQDLRATARVVVGPDEPFDDRTREDMETDHWNALAHAAKRHGVDVTAAGLKRLPHDVVLSEQVLARLGADPGRSGQSG
ncbi:hypothetical protein DI005_18565 [Prauserella sp. PE36]|uniref:hypothetical protein n=1 Tax=Prauserella sp. PE36 TaxID=1504709 RepID=UPI000DE1F1B1|nr:hypothetical protein [Prauserella sp. PE36]RBM18473.1 hypothetical protein DI005_18565 [Prauserella sp. PE36]